MSHGPGTGTTWKPGSAAVVARPLTEHLPSRRFGVWAARTASLLSDATCG